MRWKKADIIRYYRDNEFAYGLWGRNMHYGYWDKGIRTLRQATQRFNEIVAATVDIAADDSVLDAGCGVGGSSTFLARTIGCRATGITLCPRQVPMAYRNARKQGVEHLCRFYEMNYEKTGFKAGTFDVVWGLESICYAESKQRFVNEASRVLRDGGRLVVADGFSSREHYEGNDAKLMRRWMDGWLVNTLDTPDAFRRYALDAGFRETGYTNVTPQVMMTSRLMFMVSMPFIVLHLIDKLIPLPPYPTDALFNQYPALKRGLWEYGVFWARK